MGPHKLSMARHRRNLSYSRSMSRRCSWSRNSRSRSRSPTIYSDKFYGDKLARQDSHVDSNNWDSTSDYRSNSINSRRRNGSKAKPWAQSTADQRRYIIIRNLPNSLWDREELNKILSKQTQYKEFTLKESDKSVVVDYGSSHQAIIAYKDLSHRLRGCKILRVSLNENAKGNHKYESDDFQARLNKIASLESMKKNLIEKYSLRLKELIANLSKCNADEKEELLDQVHKLKSRIKILSVKSQVPKYQNSIDNRSSTLIFESLPECAQGPGKLAKWISENPLLQGSQIVSLKRQDQSVLITYSSASIANTVKNACALHGIQSKIHCQTA